jgi:hypothetical protein
MVVRLSALSTRRTLPPRNITISMFLVLVSFRGWVNPRAYCGRKNYVNLKITSLGIEPRPSSLLHSALTTTLLCGAPFFKPFTKLTQHCNHRSGYLKTNHTERLLLLRRHFENWSRSPAVSMRGGLLVAHEKRGQFVLLAMYVVLV